MSDISIDYQRARINMVESQVKPGGVRNMDIWDVMSEIPRELFVEETQKPVAYMDKQVAMSAERPLLAPLTFALLIEAAGIQKGDLVMDIACGTGYSTAVLAALGCAVVGIDQDEALCETGTQILQDLGVDSGVIISGQHAAGQAKQGPYDVILINGFVPHVPQALLDQLVPGGRLVCVTTHNNTSCGMIFTKINDSISRTVAFETLAAEVPGFEKEETFSF
ncbi:MAG: protein-L-isoaspartate O-methyltransferase family protein [Parvibaculales bacterium]